MSKIERPEVSAKSGQSRSNVNHHGLKIRHARLSKGFTLKDLSERVGCSESMISKLENTRLSPSLAMLHRIATELGIPASDLLMQEDDPHFGNQVTLLPADRFSGPSAEEEASGMSVWFNRILPLSRSGLLQVSILHLLPGGEQPRFLSHEGEEFIYVLDGTLQVIVEDQTYAVQAGTGTAFASTREHRYSNTGTQTVRAFWVNTPPTSG